MCRWGYADPAPPPDEPKPKTRGGKSKKRRGSGSSNQGGGGKGSRGRVPGGGASAARHAGSGNARGNNGGGGDDGTAAEAQQRRRLALRGAAGASRRLAQDRDSETWETRTPPLQVHRACASCDLSRVRLAVHGLPVPWAVQILKLAGSLSFAVQMYCTAVTAPGRLDGHSCGRARSH